jgi:hypothetical protein
MEPRTWTYTRLSEHDPQLIEWCNLAAGELAIVSCRVSPESWYVFTTRRVVAQHNGKCLDAQATHVKRETYGDFKGHDGAKTRTMTLNLHDGTKATVEYETGRASMAPLYYFSFWGLKYPILDKLKHDPSEGRTKR